MKKLFFLSASLLCITSIHATQQNKQKATQQATQPINNTRMSTAQTNGSEVHSTDIVIPTETEKAALDRIARKFMQRYEDLGVHELITEALQEIADDNRVDFEVLLKFAGIKEQEGSNALFFPIGPVWFRVE